MSDLVKRLRAAAALPAHDTVSAVRKRLLLDEAASRLEALEAEAEALAQKCSALAVAHGPLTCGCSYDRPDDICAAHSPQLMAARARLEALEQAAAPFVRAWGDEMFQWTAAQLAELAADGAPVSNPRYGNQTPIWLVIEPGQDCEEISDDYLFTTGDLRALARAAGGGE